MKNRSLPQNYDALALSALSKGRKSRTERFRSAFVKVPAILALAFSCATAKAQMSGAYNVPTDFPTLAAAISSLNTVGLSGGVVININAGHTETAPVGGYSLTATGTSANSILIQKTGSGANPLLTAYAGGNGTPGTAVQDGVFRLIGSDYVTIISVDISDPNTSNPATMEFGYGLFKASPTDGCHNVTILNCVITLNRENNAAGTFPAAHGSRGIDVVNALPSAHTTALAITAASGANSNNGFFNNTIQNCNYGVVLNGFADTAPYAFSDSGNNMSGNSVIDFGGATNAVNASAAVLASAQQNLNVNGNKFISNTGAGVNHPAALHGVYIDVANNSVNSVSGNTVTVLGGGTTSQVTAIETAAISGGAGATLNMSGNRIENCTYPTATSGVFYGIFNSSACGELTINGNNFVNNSTAASSGEYYNIYNSGAVTASVFINGNQIETGDFTAATVSSTISNIFCANAGSSAYIGMSGNTFQATDFLGATGGTGPYSGIVLTATSGVVFLAGNTFLNLNLKTTGTVHMIHNVGSSPDISVFGNSIGGSFARTLSSGDTYFYYGNNSAVTGTASISYNTISNVSQSGTSAFYGIYNTATISQKEIFDGNTFSQISSGSGLVSVINVTGGNATDCKNNSINTITSSGNIYGIECHSGLAGNRIYQNSVYGLQSTGASTLYPVYVSPLSSANIFRNKIYDIEANNASGAAFGIYIAAGASLATQSDTIYNNLLADIRTPLANAAMPLAGIFVAGGTDVYVWHNSVHLSASSTGALFGSAALFASSNTNLQLTNNILVNVSTPSGAGITSAYTRSSNNLSTYLAGSDNNLFYAGAVAPAHAIYYDGTTAYSYLSAYKTLLAGRDLSSVTENPPFVSLVGGNSAFLDINPAVATQVESGGIPVQVADDYSGTSRNLTTPDIGAWENTYLAAGDLSSPTLFGSGFISSNCNTTTRTLTLTLNDFSGVASGAQSPRIYYKVNNGAYSSVPGTLISGTSLAGVWSFNLNYTAAATDVISYYLVAQDISTTPNVLAAPANGFVGTDVNTVITAPATLNSYSILTSPVILTSAVSACAGSSVALTPTVTGAATYTWNGPAGYTASTGSAVIASASAGSAGVYTLYAESANSCSATATTSLTVNALPTVSLATTPSNICVGETASLSASGAASYVWMPGTMTTQVISVSPNATTAYTVVGTTTAGCSDDASVSLVVDNCTGISKIAKANAGISVYPNPSSGLITVAFEFEGNKQLVIVNALGAVVKELNTAKTSETIDMSALDKGIYFVKTINPAYSATIKVVVE